MYTTLLRNDYLLVSAVIICSVFNQAVNADANIQAIELYSQHCANCHGADRLGGTGPALLPENLTRVIKEQAYQTILAGLPATQMPPFQQILDDMQIRSLVEYIYTPLPEMPVWTIEEIKQSHTLHQLKNPQNDKPVFDADPLNLFLVIETGDHHATVLDGDRMEPLFRFKTRYALHGGPKYSPDGRFVFLSSRDGWISKFDLYNLELVAEIRAGINTRNIAVSSDGRYVIAGNYLPHTLVIMDALDLSSVKIIPVTDSSGKSSRVSAVYDAPPRNSFIVALKDIPEIFEIIYDQNAGPVYTGMVHDYRYQEGIPDNSPFPIRRIRLDDYLDDFFFDQKYNNLIGAARNAKDGQVVSLIVGKKIADIDLSGLPHLGSGVTWEYQGKTVLATPNLEEGLVSIIDVTDWSVIKRIKTLGPGFFMRTHENTPYAWVDVFSGPHKDAVHIIDKATLEIVKTLVPSPGKTSGHVEFTRDGRYALLSIWENDGALVVYDANTLEEVKRIKMNKPAGKYNVYNKIKGSGGTSH
jgi:WD40 repeat protein